MRIIFNQIKKNNDYPAKTPAIIFPFQKNDFCGHSSHCFNKIAKKNGEMSFNHQSNLKLKWRNQQISARSAPSCDWWLTSRAQQGAKHQKTSNIARSLLHIKGSFLSPFSKWNYLFFPMFDRRCCPFPRSNQHHLDYYMFSSGFL